MLIKTNKKIKEKNNERKDRIKKKEGRVEEGVEGVVESRVERGVEGRIGRVVER